MTNIRMQKPQHYRRIALMVTALSLVIVFVLYNVPDVRWLLYPLQLLTTYVHEAGHGLAAILTGGEVRAFVVSADTSGYAITAGGWRWVVLPAGYVGTALVGSVMFYLVNRFPRAVNPIASGLGFGMIAFTLLFARPDETGIPLAILIGVGMGLILIVMGLRAPTWITALLMNVVAVSLALEAFFKLRYLMATSASRGNIQDDVTVFQQTFFPLIPREFIALTWAALAVVLFSVALYYGAWKPFRQEIGTSYDALRG